MRNQVTNFMYYIFNRWSEVEAIKSMVSIQVSTSGRSTLVIRSVILVNCVSMPSWIMSAARSWLTGLMNYMVTNSNDNSMNYGELHRLYPTLSNKEIAVRLGVSLGHVAVAAHRMGWKKDPDYLSRVNRKNGKKE